MTFGALASRVADGVAISLFKDLMTFPQQDYPRGSRLAIARRTKKLLQTTTTTQY
jgi:hypothetical protein